MTRELFRLPNLLSLFRVLITPVIGFLLAGQGSAAVWYAFGLVWLVALSDVLDGYLARRMGQVSRLGVALDPVADKLFAAIMIVLLVVYRDLPVWLAALILGRDAAIIGLGWLLMRGTTITLPSNIVGKYAFAAVALLIMTNILRFDLGIQVSTWLVVGLTALSTFGYGRVLYYHLSHRPMPPVPDRFGYKLVRWVLSGSILAWLLWRLWVEQLCR